MLLVNKNCCCPQFQKAQKDNITRKEKEEKERKAKEKAVLISVGFLFFRALFLKFLQADF